MISLEKIRKAKYAGDIFTNDKNVIKAEYKAYCKQWHPDLNNNSDESNEATSSINKFYSEAVALLDAGKWEKSNYAALSLINNKTLSVTYQNIINFELGLYYVCNKSVLYCIEKKYDKLYKNFKETLGKLKFPNPKMEEEFKRFLPTITFEGETAEYFLLGIKKEEDVFPLVDVHKFYNKQMPHKHVAWIINRLYNLECFLNFNKIVYNAFTLESLFINPQFHGMFLYGGWWFSKPIGEKLISVPTAVYNSMSYEDKQKGIATETNDTGSIRRLARELLGDSYGGKILADKEIPQPIKEWILDRGTSKPLEEYKGWNNALDTGYGKRIFMKMDIDKNKLYE